MEKKSFTFSCINMILFRSYWELDFSIYLMRNSISISLTSLLNFASSKIHWLTEKYVLESTYIFNSQSIFLRYQIVRLLTWNYLLCLQKIQIALEVISHVKNTSTYFRLGILDRLMVTLPVPQQILVSRQCLSWERGIPCNFNISKKFNGFLKFSNFPQHIPSKRWKIVFMYLT